MEDQATTSLVAATGEQSRALKAGIFLGRFCREKPLGALGAVLIIFMSSVALLAPWIAPYDPLVADFDAFAAPSAAHLMGTDHLGRDIFSRVVWGARLSLYIGLVSVGISVTLGSIWGVFSAFYGGKVDVITQRVVDVLMGFPPIILTLVLISALGQSVTNVIIALVILLTPSSSRTMRSTILGLMSMSYVESARAVGASDLRVVFRHLWPNALGTYIVLFTVNVAYAIVVEAALSFLGLGAPPDEPSWGTMLTGATDHMERAPWMVFFPGIAITLVVFGINLLGDAIRDVTDAKLRGASEAKG